MSKDRTLLETRYGAALDNVARMTVGLVRNHMETDAAFSARALRELDHIERAHLIEVGLERADTEPAKVPEPVDGTRFKIILKRGGVALRSVLVLVGGRWIQLPVTSFSVGGGLRSGRLDIALRPVDMEVVQE